MAKKLKNLKVNKVDFVDEGANPDAKMENRRKIPRNQKKTMKRERNRMKVV